jgi:hypothetical protein
MPERLTKNGAVTCGDLDSGEERYVAIVDINNVTCSLIYSLWHGTGGSPARQHRPARYPFRLGQMSDAALHWPVEQLHPYRLSLRSERHTGLGKSGGSAVQVDRPKDRAASVAIISVNLL